MAEKNTEWNLSTIDGIIQALYGCISFAAGSEPRWVDLRNLFLPQGQLLKAGAEDTHGSIVLHVDEFIEKTRSFLSDSLLQRRGFVETEIMRKTEAFGRIAHIFSTYESRFFSGSGTHLARGTNSIQMLRKDGRWWLVSVMWDEEGQGRILPDAYLPQDIHKKMAVDENRA